MVHYMEPASGLSSEPTGFVFAKCSRSNRITCIGVKSYVQRYWKSAGLSVKHASGKESHYFGRDVEIIFGFNQAV